LEVENMAVPVSVEQELLSRAEVARMMGVGEGTVSRWEKAGYLHRIKFGNILRFRKEDIQAFIDANYVDNEAA
jgi:excisionase family DNA binding protein